MSIDIKPMAYLLRNNVTGQEYLSTASMIGRMYNPAGCTEFSLYTADQLAAARAHDQAQIAEVAMRLHYPECWDTAAYPTIYDALLETAAHADCSECGKDPASASQQARIAIAEAKKG